MGLAFTISDRVNGGMLDGGSGKYVGLSLMAIAVIMGVSGYMTAQDLTRANAEREIIDEKDAILEQAETDRRLELISEKLDVEQSEVIVYPARNGLFNAETSDGKYLIEFDETHEEIAKMIKLPN